MIRQLTFTNLFPSTENPRHGIFVEQRLRRLVETGRLVSHVVVPCGRAPRRRAPQEGRCEQRHGMNVCYTGFPVLRGVTTPFHPRLMFRGATQAVQDWQRQGVQFDLVDGQFLYPDGVAAAFMAQRLGLPLLLTARGSDVNVALDERIAGRSIRWAISRSAAVITVSAALRQALLDRGIPAEKLLVIRNGVDLEAFAPVDREAARRQAGLAGTVLLSVGNLVPEKGHDLTLAALALLPEARLVLIGSGASESGLRAQAQSLGVADRVTWLAPMPQRELSVYYSAADVTVLASVREGMPNVLLESLACGTPAVASRIGGVPEVLTDPVAGVMLSVRSPEALASACREVIRRSTDPRAVRGFAESFGWKVPIAQQLDLLCRVTGRQ